MAETVDLTLPGKAGLHFCCDDLLEAGWAIEHAARARLERWCLQCGQRAVYGYGETLTREGVLSCADRECRAASEAQAAQRDRVEPIAEVSTDLFGRAA